jgi:outer membrane protein OmpA-like peptidoglycan-associated protein
MVGCASPRGKASFVLLPEEGHPSGLVSVTNAQGEQLLERSYQSVTVARAGEAPGKPVQLSSGALNREFGAVLGTLPPAPLSFQLYFELDSSQLVPESQRLLPEIARAVRERYPAQVTVVGHADTTGPEAYNMQLGLRRAAAVAGQLKGLGANPVGVETASRGKADLLVPTPDQTPEPRNRRAEVTVR